MGFLSRRMRCTVCVRRRLSRHAGISQPLVRKPLYFDLEVLPTPPLRGLVRVPPPSGPPPEVSPRTAGGWGGSYPASWHPSASRCCPGVAPRALQASCTPARVDRTSAAL